MTVRVTLKRGRSESARDARANVLRLAVANIVSFLAESGSELTLTGLALAQNLLIDYYFLSKVDAKRLYPVSPYLTGARLLKSERGFTRRERNESRGLDRCAADVSRGDTDVEIGRRDTANLHRPVQLL